MSRPDPKEVNHITSLGGGPIGGGWTAYFLARGYSVTAYLHDASEEPMFRDIVNTAWISLEALGLAEGASIDRLDVTNDLAEAVNGAEFIQESAPEILPLKQSLYEQLSPLVPEEIVIS